MKAIEAKNSDVVRGIDEVFKVLRAAGGGEEAEPAKPPEHPNSIGRLKNCAARMRHVHQFKKGQLVQWKEGLKNKKTPAYGEPVIVVDVLKEPVYDYESKGSGNPYFSEPLTLVAGELAPNGDFVCFHYDGRRFEPYLEGCN